MKRERKGGPGQEEKKQEGDSENVRRVERVRLWRDGECSRLSL